MDSHNRVGPEEDSNASPSKKKPGRTRKRQHGPTSPARRMDSEELQDAGDNEDAMQIQETAKDTVSHGSKKSGSHKTKRSDSHDSDESQESRPYSYESRGRFSSAGSANDQAVDLNFLQNASKHRLALEVGGVENGGFELLETPGMEDNHSGDVHFKEARKDEGFDPKDKTIALTLHQCARDGLEYKMRVLLERLSSRVRKKKVNQFDADDMAPLHYAARNNFLNVAKLLVENGADVSKPGGSDDMTPLHMAARFGKDRKKRDIPEIHDEGGIEGIPLQDQYESEIGPSSNESVINYLISMGADINVEDKYKQTPLHFAAMRGNEAACRDLLRHASVNIEAQDMQEYTPLHMAAIYNQVDIARTLIASGANLFAVDDEMSTPLHHACREGNINLVKILIEAGARTASPTKMLDAKDCEGSTCLHLAVDNRHHEVAKLCLEKGAQVNVPRKRNMYPLHLAAMSGDIRIVRLLVEHKAKIDVINDEASTPLHKAASLNRAEVVEYLLKSGARLECRDKDDYTPLLLAVTYGHVDTVEILLRKGADFRAMDKYDKTAIYLAAEENKCVLLEKLLAHPKVEKLINCQDEDDYSPLHIACEKGHLEVVKVLLKHKADVHSMNEEQQKPIHLAAKFGRTNIVRELANYDMSLLNDEDENSNTALHLAALYGHEKVTEVLLNFGADVDARNYNQWTPLDLAASKGWVRTCTELLYNDAPVDATDKNMTTPLHLAARHGHPRVVELLLDWGADITQEDREGLNCLDHAIENSHSDVALRIINSPHWQQALRNSDLDSRTADHKKHGGLETKPLDTPMRKLITKMPDVAKRVFDRCMCIGEEKNPDHPDYEITFNFEFLDDTYAPWMNEEYRKQMRFGDTASVSETSSVGDAFDEDEDYLLSTAKPYTEDSKFLRENHPLAVMVSSQREQLLDHPLVMSLLSHKWETYGRIFYYTSLSVYCIFLAFLTGYVIQVNPPSYYTSADQREIQRDNCTGLSKDYEHPVFSSIGTYVIMVLSILHLIKEVLQFLRAKLSYLGWINLIECTIFITAFLYVVSFNDCQQTTGYRYDWQWQLGAVAIFLAWLNLLLFIQKFPRFGIYVVMFTNVLRTFVQFFFVFFLFIVAFGLAFYVLLQQQVPFEYGWKALIKTFVMMIGEFDYNDIFNDGSNTVEFPVLTYIIFIAFVIAMAILIMNLLTGLAVDDTKAALEQAALARMAMQIQLTLDVERLIPFSLLIRLKAIVKRKTIKPNQMLRNPVARFFTSQFGLTPKALKTYLNPERKELEKLQERQDILAKDVKKLERAMLDVRETSQQMKSMLKALLKNNDIKWHEEDYQEEDEVAQIQAGLSYR